MKKARLSVAAFEITCPHCRENCENPYSGSLLWAISEFTEGEAIKCSECEGLFRLPKRVADNLLEVLK